MQMHDVPVAISEDLNLEMLRAGDVFLEEYGGIAKRAAGLGLGFIEQLGEIAGFEEPPACRGPRPRRRP